MKGTARMSPLRASLLLMKRLFDNEVNMRRLEEFRVLADDRLVSKRPLVIDNYRKHVAGRDPNEVVDQLKATDEAELVHMHFHLRHSLPEMKAIADTLVTRSQPNAFRIFRLVFPDAARYAGDTVTAFFAGRP